MLSAAATLRGLATASRTGRRTRLGCDAAAEPSRGQPLPSELAVELVLTRHLAFRLALRRAEASRRSVPRLPGLALSIPGHSTSSRTAGQITTPCPALDARIKAAIDSVYLRAVSKPYGFVWPGLTGDPGHSVLRTPTLLSRTGS